MSADNISVNPVNLWVGGMEIRSNKGPKWVEGEGFVALCSSHRVVARNIASVFARSVAKSPCVTLCSVCRGCYE